MSEPHVVEQLGTHADLLGELPNGPRAFAPDAFELVDEKRGVRHRGGRTGYMQW